MSDETFRFDECAICTGPAWLNRASTWCGRHRPMLLIAAGIFQVLVLAAMTAIHAAPLIVGETILLQVEPVDPRDLFRGDYVALSYAINRVPPEGIEGIARSADDYGQRREPEERTVYVSLAPEADGKHWHGTKVSVHRPASGKFISGLYRCYPYGPGRLEFGIETFYVPEGTGHRYEDAARQRHLTAEIALAPWGQAKLRGLRISD